MNTEIVKTDYFREKRVDVIVIDGVEYFIVDQIACALEYKNTDTLYRSIRRVDFREGELKKVSADKMSALVGFRTRDDLYYLVNEQGLYRILIHSRSKLAESFQDWLIYEVLPSIRKKGYYIGKRADPEQVKLELKQKELDLARVKSNDRHLLAEQLDRLEKSETTDPRWINHSRMLLVADIAGQRIDFEMEINLSDFLKERGHKATESELISFGRMVAKIYKQVRGHTPKKTKKQLKTGIREVNYYSVEDFPLIEKAYDQWIVKQVYVSDDEKYKLVNYM